MTRFPLSENELAILNVLWDADAPLSRPEILAGVVEHNWNSNSIHMILNNLIKKGFLQVAGVTRCGQSYGRTYYTIKTKSEYAADLALGTYSGKMREEDVVDVVAAMVRKANIGEETIGKLKDMLDARRMELLQCGAPEK